jgi:hypothetical protein
MKSKPISTQARAGGENHPQGSLTATEDWVVDITRAEHAEEYRLRLWFSDGKEQVVDFEPFLRHSLNPMIRKYLEPERFQRFTVEHGDLFWGDYELCFPIADLYEGRI